MTVLLTLCVIARKIWNVGFDISVARNSAHLAISLRALGSLLGSSQSHRSSFGLIPTLCFCFLCSASLPSTALIIPVGTRLLIVGSVRNILCCSHGGDTVLSDGFAGLILQRGCLKFWRRCRANHGVGLYITWWVRLWIFINEDPLAPFRNACSKAFLVVAIVQ